MDESDMVRTTGVSATKYEPSTLADQLSINIEEQQSIDMKYKINRKADIAQIKRVADGNIVINYPVESADRLADLKLIESQFGGANAIRNPDPDLVDTAIISGMPYYLAEEGVDIPDNSTLAARVKALIFMHVRGIKYRTDLLEYLNSHLNTAQSLGLKIADSTVVGGESTLSRAATEYGIDRKPVQDAICRLRHALSRNGLWVIGASMNQPIPPSVQLPGRLRCQGLINYSDMLLNRCLDISFGRGQSVKYSAREIMGALAQMALHDNPTKARRLAHWHYKSDIITLQRILQIISENFYRGNILLAKSSIERLDKKLHQDIFRFSNNIGMFTNPLNIALDPTWVPVTDDVDDTPGAIKNPTISNEAEGGFSYPMAVAYGPVSLSLGVKYITNKSNYPNAFRQLLSRIKDIGEIGWILADREFDSEDMIDLLRNAAGKKWIIRVREHAKVITTEVSQSLKENGKAQASIGDNNINIFSRKFKISGHPYIDEDENMILLSDMPIDDTDISTMIRIYMKRWAVETYIRQIKHSFSPKLEKERAPINQFMFTIASVFYNIWAIINQSVSPVYGLPIRARYYDVLRAIVESTLTDRREIYPQIEEIYR